MNDSSHEQRAHPLVAMKDIMRCVAQSNHRDETPKDIQGREDPKLLPGSRYHCLHGVCFEYLASADISQALQQVGVAGVLCAKAGVIILDFTSSPWNNTK